MKKLNKIIIPALLILTASAAVMAIINNPPKSEGRSRGQENKMNVAAAKIAPRDFQVKLASYGVVQPKTRTSLISQVSGEVVYLSDKFREGGFFNKGERLLTVDPRDYRANVDIARAALAAADLALKEEQARGTQALEDWLRLRKDEKPDELAMRKPQLAYAKANLGAARAELNKALLALERTEIKAPYNGRVLSKQVDIGQVIAGNSLLGEIYATDVVEVRLPVNNEDLPLLDLPEEFRQGSYSQQNIRVHFTSDLYQTQTWQGQVVRTEGAIDQNSQQLYVVAEIKDPFSISKDQSPVKIGQYVNATIFGKLLTDAIVIDKNTIYQESYVYTLVNEALKRTDIDIRWQNETLAIIDRGLSATSILVSTPLGMVSSGTRVNVINAGGSPNKRPGKDRGKGKNKDKQQSIAAAGGAKS
ncbi:efflux RND transporter periplasmic adaptor subunit [Thalassomonas sp. RHCl1]|uniref:efflux RND transporter periplasmic adaptor subunit n=1 Tax=Thalassomonas sp. RHCl1 TaxID=2995320 RepID=UPI00248C7263|nr:efflux RND transporter periplasmic adaptor subunit [Thalassomonas sp. RHCl1]